jgi:hypothetical protein
MHTHTEEYYPARRKNMLFEETWMGMEIIM